MQVHVDLVRSRVRGRDRERVGSQVSDAGRRCSSSSARRCSSGRANAKTRCPSWADLPEDLRDLRRSAQVLGGGLLHCCLRDVAEEVGAVRRLGERRVLLLQRDVDHVLGVDRHRPAFDLDGPGELEQRREPGRVDGHHAVDGSDARVRSERHEHLPHAGEVGRQVDVLELRSGRELRVAVGVVGGRVQRVQRGWLRARASFHSRVRFRRSTCELAVVGGEHAVVADEAAGGAGLGVVLHRRGGSDEGRLHRRGQARVERPVSRGRPRPCALASSRCTSSARVADLRDQVRIVAHLLQPMRPASSRTSVARASFGVMARTSSSGSRPSTTSSALGWTAAATDSPASARSEPIAARLLAAAMFDAR